MRKTRITAGLTATLLAGALAACGGGSASNDGGSGGGGGATQTVSADEYASGVCQSVSGWLKGLSKESSKLVQGMSTGTSPEEGKKAFVGFFGSAAERTDELVTDVEKVGAPDVEGGEEASADLLDGLEKTKQSFASAQSKAEDLPTGSKEEFQAGAQAISSTLQQETSGIQDSMDVTKRSQDLKKAFEDAKECQSPGAAPDGGGL
ncbi:hypothetical protein BH18ACT15_BH18ACT15_06340 [soil metagenome]